MSLKEFISIYIIAVRQTATVDYIFLYHFQRLWKAAIKPIEFFLMYIEIRIIFMSSDMIPVNMRSNSRYGLIG